MDQGKEIYVSEIDECSLSESKGQPVSNDNKSTLNEKTQKLFSSISKFSVSQLIRRRKSNRNRSSITEQPGSNSTDSIDVVRTNSRPVSMFLANPYNDLVDSDKYMHDSTLLMALRETESRLLESENYRIHMEGKLETMETEIQQLRDENEQYRQRERALQSQIGELERRVTTECVANKEANLTTRIREMELTSELATLSQRVAEYETQKQEKIVRKIMESQGRLVEQTIPYAESLENIYDCEDGLFDNTAFTKFIKEQHSDMEKVAVSDMNKTNDPDNPNTATSQNISDY